jgi:hypothetical protein
LALTHASLQASICFQYKDIFPGSIQPALPDFIRVVSCAFRNLFSLHQVSDVPLPNGVATLEAFASLFHIHIWHLLNQVL